MLLRKPSQPYVTLTHSRVTGSIYLVVTSPSWLVLRMLTTARLPQTTSISLPLAHSPDPDPVPWIPRAFLDLPVVVERQRSRRMQRPMHRYSPVNASHAVGTTLASFTERETSLMFLLLLALLLLLLGALLLCTQMHWVASELGPENPDKLMNAGPHRLAQFSVGYIVGSTPAATITSTFASPLALNPCTGYFGGCC